MAEFSITNAAFAGFRLAREKPKTIAVWFVLSLVVSVLFAVVMVNMAGPAMMEMRELSRDPTANPMAVAQVSLQTMPFMLVASLMGVVITAIVAAAATRAILRPAEEGLGYLRFGGDELRLLVVFFVIGVIMTVVYMVGSVVFSIAGVAIAGAMGGGIVGPDGAPSPELMRTAQLFVIPVIIPLGFLAVKFSLASAQTVDSKAISIFGSWGLTKGRFMRLLGTYLLALALYLLVVALGLVIIAAVAAVMGGGMEAARTIFEPDTSSLQAYFTPVMIVYTVMASLLGALGWAILFAPPAVIYAEVAQRGADEAFE